MGFNIVEVQPTPNPNALKFLLDRSISEQPISYFDAQAAHGNAAATRLFAIPGVSSLLLLGDFVTVNKTPDASWPELKTLVKRALAELQV